MGVVGAILDFAVTVTSSLGFDVNTAGLIFVITGIVLFALGVVVVVAGCWRRTTVREDLFTTPQGQFRREQSDDVG